MIEFLCIFITVLSIIIPAIAFQVLPEKIPTHYGIEGQPDSYAEKANIWLLPILSLISLLGFYKAISLIKNEVRHQVNKVLLIKSFILLNLGVLLLFLALNVYTILISLHVCDELGVWYYLSMALLFVFPLLPVIKNKFRS